MNRAVLKQHAKDSIRGKIGILFVIYLIVAAISGAISAVPYVGALAAAVVITPVFALAIVKIYLRLAEGVAPKIGDLFTEFNNFWSAFKVQFLSGLFIALWSLLLVIPGIIKAYAYSQAMYILAENPEIGAREALKRSEEMMKGHKMELFILQLSFIGWELLGAITFGIAYIWVLPFYQATMTNFYNEIKIPTVENPVEF